MSQKEYHLKREEKSKTESRKSEALQKKPHKIWKKDKDKNQTKQKKKKNEKAGKQEKRWRDIEKGNETETKFGVEPKLCG